jgi:hypothetical protein
MNLKPNGFGAPREGIDPPEDDEDEASRNRQRAAHRPQREPV